MLISRRLPPQVTHVSGRLAAMTSSGSLLGLRRPCVVTAGALQGGCWGLGGRILRVRREEVPLRGVFGGAALGLRADHLAPQAREFEGEGLELLHQHPDLLAEELVLGSEGGGVHALPYPS